MEISAQQVKELRERTGLGLMECKGALKESQGDVAEAVSRGDYASALESSRKCIDVSTEQGYPDWIGFGYIHHGAARAGLGELTEGLAEYDEGFRRLREAGNGVEWLRRYAHESRASTLRGRFAKLGGGLDRRHPLREARPRPGTRRSAQVRERLADEASARAMRRHRVTRPGRGFSSRQAAGLSRETAGLSRQAAELSQQAAGPISCLRRAPASRSC